MTDSIARSIGSGRFLGWKAVNAEGASGGREDALWEEFGAIRGLWEDPWGEILLGMGANNQTWARLDSGGWDKTRPTPFRFENMWLKAEGFKELVRSWWQGIDVRGSASYKLATKMKEIKQKLKVWNREVFEEQEIREGIANAFKELLSEDTGWKADIGSLQLDQISQEEAEILERPFTEDEIHGA
ncbi:hypothetical protein CK203_106639 [Vitis vinifera]|uniref:Uncharacterized protein n=1 Tax=Vitis vinifera TaxID=29760 RepID=A0A438E4D8_VITVI|nr:hypothetical protein CK203_106639 [Vitis vinifera]